MATSHASPYPTALAPSRRYNKRANARWEVLIHKQLAPEAAAPCDPAKVAGELRKAEAKIKSLEELLIEGLAEYSDARGALRMHMFNKDADIPLRMQLANRLAGTMFGELLGQRFEHLDAPEVRWPLNHPRLLALDCSYSST